MSEKVDVHVNEFAFKETIIARFLPAIITCMVWLYLVTYEHGGVYSTTNGTCAMSPAIGTMWGNFFDDNWPMSCAMVLGSLIAGSTPLGGGVVAFPIAVLVLKLTPGQGRDFTVLIQSVGMNAAGYLLLLRKAHLLDFTLISMFVVMGVPGVLVGLSADIIGFYVVVFFQVLVLEFAIVFFYLNVLSPVSTHAKPALADKAETASLAVEMAPASDRSRSPGIARPGVAPVMSVPVGMGDEAAAADGQPPHVEVLDWRATQEKMKLFATYGLMAAFAFAGGFLTAKVGSGSDIMLFAYGHFVWNVLMPERSFKDNQLTASSVITMGLLSLVTALCRALTRQISQRTLEVWGAASWIVCFGAPLGSLLLTPALQSYLRIAFYLLAIGQFIGFAVLKIADPPPIAGSDAGSNAWTIFGVASAVILASLAVHFVVVKQRIKARGLKPDPITCRSMLMRLLPECWKPPV